MWYTEDDPVVIEARYREAFAIYRKHMEQSPDAYDLYDTKIAEIYYKLAELLRLLFLGFRDAEAFSFYQEALEIHNRKGTKNGYADATAACRIYIKLAEMKCDEGDYREAEDFCRKALDLCLLSLAKSDPGFAVLTVLLVDVYGTLINILKHSSDRNEEIDTLREQKDRLIHRFLHRKLN